jgi:hypothetical protein
VLDDHSRAIAGYSLLTDAPSTLNTALALRQAIWRKGAPARPICGKRLWAMPEKGSISGHVEDRVRRACPAKRGGAAASS